MVDFGDLTRLDKLELERSLYSVNDRFPGQRLRLVEIGVRDGRTARGVQAVLRLLKADFEYWGVDNGRECREVPFQGCNFVWGDSAEAAPHVPDGLHWVLVDGCHCQRHVVLDFVQFGARVVPGGLVLVHDATPNMPAMHNHQHGPRDQQESFVCPRLALKRMGLLPPVRRRDWILVADVFEDRVPWGGLAVYEKGKS